MRGNLMLPFTSFLQDPGADLSGISSCLAPCHPPQAAWLLLLLKQSCPSSRGAVCRAWAGDSWGRLPPTWERFGFFPFMFFWLTPQGHAMPLLPLHPLLWDFFRGWGQLGTVPTYLGRGLGFFPFMFFWLAPQGRAMPLLPLHPLLWDYKDVALSVPAFPCPGVLWLQVLYLSMILWTNNALETCSKTMGCCLAATQSCRHSRSPCLWCCICRGRQSPWGEEGRGDRSTGCF